MTQKQANQRSQVLSYSPEKQDVSTPDQPEQGSPKDVQGDTALRSSSPLNDRMNEKSEEALEEA